MAYKRISPMPIAEGGTNASTMATTDGTIYFDGTSLVTTATGTSGWVLTSGGAGVAPAYAVLPSSGITTAAGDTGTATGSTVTWNAASNAGGTALFTATGSTVSLNVTDSSQNTILGANSAQAGTSGSSTLNTAYGYQSMYNVGAGASANCAFGAQCFNGLTSGTNNVGIGFQVGITNSITGTNHVLIGSGCASTGSISGTSNVAIGVNAMQGLSAANYNTCVGSYAGFAYANSEESNICIGQGVNGAAFESNTLRIGAGSGAGPGALSSAYIAGIASVTVSNKNYVTIDTSTNQLGSDAGPSSSITLTGDSGGGLTGASFTFDANSQAGKTVSFSGSGTTLSLNVTDGSRNVMIGQFSGNTNGGTNCVALGDYTLYDSQGDYNVSIGDASMSQSTTSGDRNTSVGASSAAYLSTGYENCFFGFEAGRAHTTGFQSTFIGYASGGTSTITGNQNTAVGSYSLQTITSGSYNTCIGTSSGGNLTSTESSNICIGQGVYGATGVSNGLYIGTGTGTGNGNINSTFISGIQTIVVTGTAVLVSTSDQLGVLASGRQFKNDIQDMKDDSSPLLKLRPVTFVWNKKSSPGLANATDERQFGLIADEVAEVFPSLVTYKDKEPFSVKYSELPAILLNELQKALKRIDALEAKLKG